MNNNRCNFTIQSLISAKLSRIDWEFSPEGLTMVRPMGLAKMSPQLPLENVKQLLQSFLCRGTKIGTHVQQPKTYQKSLLEQWLNFNRKAAISNSVPILSLYAPLLLLLLGLSIWSETCSTWWEFLGKGTLSKVFHSLMCPRLLDALWGHFMKKEYVITPLYTV